MAAGTDFTAGRVVDATDIAAETMGMGEPGHRK
jgi:hypothetical protein